MDGRELRIPNALTCAQGDMYAKLGQVKGNGTIAGGKMCIALWEVKNL